MSDRTLNRLVVVLVAILVIGVPTIGLVYFLDRNVDAGPSIAQRAIDRAEEAVRQDPNKLSSRLQLAAAYEAAGRQRDAIVQYGDVLAAQPANRSALLGRAQASADLGDLDAAARDYQALIQAAKGGEMANADPQLEAAYYGLGSISLKQGRPRDAATQLANALQINRTDADALNLMGTALIRIGDAKNAVEVLRTAVALVPSGWCDPYSQLGQAYTALQNSAGTQYAAAMVALCEKRPSEADRLLRPLVGGQLNHDALIGLGQAAEDRGDPAAAVGFYSRVYAADPADFAAITGLNRLGASPPSASLAVGASPQTGASGRAGASAGTAQPGAAASGPPASGGGN